MHTKYIATTLSALALGALLTLPVYADKKRQPSKPTQPSAEQLSIPELTCRMLGVYVQEYATQRDRGVPITDALINLYAWIDNAGHPVPVRDLHVQLLLGVYHETWLTPLLARQQFETGCVMSAYSQNANTRNWR